MKKKHDQRDEDQKSNINENKKPASPVGGSEEVENLENQLKRTLADYQNLEKRVAEEKSSWIKTANKDLILRLLPTLGHLETVLKGAKESGVQSSWLEGVKITIEEFRKVLSDEGLEPVQTENFDPNLHEVVQTQEGPEGKILDVLEMGYKLNGNLIKPAKVIVGKETN